MRASIVSLALSAAALGTAPSLAADVPAAPAGPASCSVSTATGGDIRVLTCPLAAGRAWRFTAGFSGGHDDTSASLAVTLDGQPAACGAGSKTSLFGEDGDVSLHCRIDAAGAARTLVVTVLWSHAQYRDFGLAGE
jgi:hypothetical protein